MSLLVWVRSYDTSIEALDNEGVWYPLLLISAFGLWAGYHTCCEDSIPTLKRATKWLDELGLRMGRRAHKTIISIILILWLFFVFGFIAVLILNVPTVNRQVTQWRGVLIGVQIVIGGLMIVAIYTWLNGNEELGLRFAVIGFLLSLVALQTLYFYLSQFSALTTTLIQFIFLLILLAYRRWYLSEDNWIATV